jgi:succinate-semialdehyde dehydrogenase/glutarate-semialdehyde dehydrogenase
MNVQTWGAVVQGVDTGLLIGGEVREARSGRTFTVENPATGEALCEVADGEAKDGLEALAVATEVQARWPMAPPRMRGEILRRTYDLMIERMDELALLITLEMGKSLVEARAEVTYAADYIRWFGEEAVRIEGEWKTGENGSSRVLTMRQPVGPCLLITPWNAPLAMPARKIAPAVAAGCTMVVKPAAQTPLTTLRLAALFHEAGLPNGVINVVPTSHSAALTEPILADRRLRKVSFTGSTPVGRLLLEQAARNVLRTSMELGGNAPFVVCSDADIDAAVEGAMVAKLRNIGEACVAANRFHVHEDVVEEFTDKLTARMALLTLGPGTEDGTDIGPMIDGVQRDRVADLVADAVEGGAKVRLGGEVPTGDGYFYPPTVLTEITAGSRITEEEIFGPVAAIQSFADDDEGIRAANDTDFGLVSYLYTRDLIKGIRLTERLESGMVGLNRGYISDPSAPFGGIKQSGVGREGGNVGIDEYLELKYVAIDLPDAEPRHDV